MPMGTDNTSPQQKPIHSSQGPGRSSLVRWKTLRQSPLYSSQAPLQKPWPHPYHPHPGQQRLNWEPELLPDSGRKECPSPPPQQWMVLAERKVRAYTALPTPKEATTTPGIFVMSVEATWEALRRHSYPFCQGSISGSQGQSYNFLKPSPKEIFRPKWSHWRILENV